MAAITFIILPFLLVCAFPVAYALLISGSVAVFWSDRFPLAMIAQRIFSPTQSFPLLAIPFFILAGELLITGGLGERMIRFATKLVGRFTGGLAQVSVIASMLFAGVSGSAVADASALGSVIIPWQKKEGYPAPFASAVNAASSTVGVIIPPSIPMIIYSTVSGSSIGALFLAGLLPGLMVGLLQLALCFWIARQSGVPVSKGIFSKKELFADFLATLPAMAMPILILVAMITGVATPTEVSVLAVFYAIGVSGLLYRDLTIKKIYSAMIRAGVATGVVMLIIMASSLLGWILTIQNVPTRLTEWFLSLTHSSVLAIGFMNCVMLFVGTFLDMPAAILLLGPVFLPLAEAIHLDLVQLGVMMTLNLAIGLFTPPVGTTLFISSTIAEIKIEDTVKALMPFYICSLLVMLLISYLPALTITP